MNNLILQFQKSLFISSNIIWTKTNNNYEIIEEHEYDEIEVEIRKEYSFGYRVKEVLKKKKIKKNTWINYLLMNFNNLKNIKDKKSIRILQYLIEYFNFKEGIHYYFTNSLRFTDDILYLIQIINTENLILPDINNYNETCCNYYFSKFNSRSLELLDYMLPHLKDINNLLIHYGGMHKYRSIEELFREYYHNEEYVELFERLFPYFTLDILKIDSRYLNYYYVDILFKSVSEIKIKILKILSPLLTQEYFDLIRYNNDRGSIWLDLCNKTNFNECCIEVLELFKPYLKQSYFNHKNYKGERCWNLIFKNTRSDSNYKFLKCIQHFFTESDITSVDGLKNNLIHTLFSTIYSQYSIKIFEEYLLNYIQKNPTILKKKNNRNETCLHNLFELINFYSIKILKSILHLLTPDDFMIQNNDEDTCLHLLFKQADRNLNYEVYKLIFPLLTKDMLELKNKYNKSCLHYLLCNLNINNNKEYIKILSIYNPCLNIKIIVDEEKFLEVEKILMKNENENENENDNNGEEEIEYEKIYKKIFEPIIIDNNSDFVYKTHNLDPTIDPRIKGLNFRGIDIKEGIIEKIPIYKDIIEKKKEDEKEIKDEEYYIKLYKKRRNRLINKNKLQLEDDTEEITYYYYICSNYYDRNKDNSIEYGICIYCGCLVEDHLTKYTSCNNNCNSCEDTGYGYCKLCLSYNKVCKIEDHYNPWYSYNNN